METELKDFLEKAELGSCNVISVLKELRDDGIKGVAAVRLENVRTMPDRMESPPRKHTFHEAAGFVEYLGQHKNPGMRVFVNMANWRIDCLIDETAKTGFEVITLQPMEHPEFSMLYQTLISQGQMTMRQLALAVMRNRGVIVDSKQQSARDLAMIMQQITVSTRTKACTGEGKHAVNGFMVETDIKAGPVEELVELPDTIPVELPICLNTEPKKFGIDITIGMERDEPVAVIDCPELVARKFEVFQEIVEPIKQMEGVFVASGQHETGEWKYNR